MLLPMELQHARPDFPAARTAIRQAATKIVQLWVCARIKLAATELARTYHKQKCVVCVVGSFLVVPVFHYSKVSWRVIGSQ